MKVADLPYHIPAPNSSGVVSGTLFGHMLILLKDDARVLLIGETNDVNQSFLNYFPNIQIDNLNYGDDVLGVPFDLNVYMPMIERYDAVYNQATLEHICRPSIAIENMANYTKVGGYIFLHTHNLSPNFYMPYHAWPIDCVRYFQDFFVDLTKYLPLELVSIHQNERDIHIVYERIQND